MLLVSLRQELLVSKGMSVRPPVMLSLSRQSAGIVAGVVDVAGRVGIVVGIACYCTCSC